ncbi:DUF2878 domain-containing protein [Variovorax sp.]|jgi:hypothetical protein|uniref:DUF2878 domain-containing protein n=1 Tax=Variovorax sp. TaxID=1871043 RepID=UPI0011F72A60|nr:DUF2878 domain-containing protein [Variovorax sp.]TAJ67704.1 MAG: DUF2878 domain-containing protein [Variovorax sp.]
MTAVRITNFVVFQLAWFAAVLGAAHGHPLWGTACIAAAIAWHLWVSARPAQEARLVAIACALGVAIETGHALGGLVRYPSGQPIAQLAPYWMVALWGLFAIALNVTLRWLHRRYLLAAVLGAVCGPASFVAGVKLGAAQFVDRGPALVVLAVVWAVAMPLLVWLAQRFDGVGEPPR